MARMGEDEFREWLAFDRICPLEDGYWQSAMLATVISHAMTARSKAKIGDFLPRTSKPKAQSPLSVFATIRGMVEAAEARKHV